MLDRVVHEIRNDLGGAIAIPPPGALLFGGDHDLRLGSGPANLGDDFSDNGRQLDVGGMNRNAAAEAGAREVEQLGNHAAGAPCAADDGERRLLLRLGEASAGDKLLRSQHHGGQRRSQIVSEDADELLPLATGYPGLLEIVFQLDTFVVGLQLEGDERRQKSKDVEMLLRNL